MKIEYDTGLYTILEKVGYGECFYYEGELYVRVVPFDSCDCEKKGDIMVLSFKNNKIYFLNKYDTNIKVMRISAKVVVK